MKPIVAVPITAILVIRSYRRKSLTPLGILAAAITATIHALPESPLPFTLLCTFFLLGTSATKVKHQEKARLTLSSSGASGGEGPRTHIQVLANSACASLLCLLEYLMRRDVVGTDACFGRRWLRFPAVTGAASPYLDWCIMGVVANYASVAADTLSSELGILSKATPVLITAPWKKVPRGTNGGVTPAGIGYGYLGAAAIAVTSVMLVPFCDGWGFNGKAAFVAAVSIWGTLGSILDSLLGAFLQASVVDKRTGKIVEGAGGVRVLTRGRASSNEVTKTSTFDGAAFRQRKNAGEHVAVETGHESRVISSGRDVLDNNGINFLMASIMTVGGIILGQLIQALV